MTPSTSLRTSWRQLYTAATYAERAAILALLLQRIHNAQPSAFAAWLVDSSRMGFIMPLLALQGAGLLIGLGLGTWLGLMIILAVNLGLVCLVMLRKAVLEPYVEVIRIKL